MPSTPLPETITTSQAASASVSPTSALLQSPQLVQPPSNGPVFAIHQRVLAPRNRSAHKYTGWITSIIFGDNGAPPTYRIRFSKQNQLDYKADTERFPEALIESDPKQSSTLPALPLLLPCLYTPLLTSTHTPNS